MNDADTAADDRIPWRIASSLRAVIAGGEAAKLIGSAVALFEAGGRLVLPEGTKTAVRSLAERGAEKALAVATGPILDAATSATALAARPATVARTALTVSRGAAAVAGRAIARGAGRAAGIGFVIDGAVASVEAVSAVRGGTMDRRGAAAHVAKEATTGALATGAGVLLGAGLVALTGAAAAPVVFAVSAIGSIGTKRALRRWTT